MGRRLFRGGGAVHSEGNGKNDLLIKVILINKLLTENLATRTLWLEISLSNLGKSRTITHHLHDQQDGFPRSHHHTLRSIPPHHRHSDGKAQIGLKLNYLGHLSHLPEARCSTIALDD